MVVILSDLRVVLSNKSTTPESSLNLTSSSDAMFEQEEISMRKIFCTSVIYLAMLGSAHAAETASGEQIMSAISGNTVQGSMMASGAYTEFYSADGTIKGKDYSGKWRVDGDKMCFTYGTDPEGCWNVTIDANQVSWVKEGTEDGTGTIVEGNPNNF